MAVLPFCVPFVSLCFKTTFQLQVVAVETQRRGQRREFFCACSACCVPLTFALFAGQRGFRISRIFVKIDAA